MEFGDVERGYVETGGFDAGAGSGEGGGEDDRVGDRQRVGGVRFGGVDVDPLEVGEWSCVEPPAMHEKRAAAEIRYGGFEVEAAGDSHGHDLVVVRRKDRGELADAFGIGARGLADVESSINAEDVAAFDRAWGRDVGEFAERCEGFRERFGFGLAGFCAEREDHGEFVEDDGGIFYEHGIGESWFGGQRMDVDAEFGEEMFVGGVLRLGFGDVDGLAIDEGEFAIGQGGADGTRDGG